MEILSSIMQYVLDFGAAIFVSVFLFIIGLVAGLKPGRALGAALTFGCAFIGVNMVTSFLTTNVGAAARAFVDAHGLSLTAIDVSGFTAGSFVMSWGYAFLFYPIQIGLNLLLLALGWTKTMNVDMWQVHQPVLTAYFIFTITNGNLLLTFAVGIAQIILQLKVADALRKDVQDLTGIPGVSIPHPHVFNCIWFYPLNKLYDLILPKKGKIDVATLRSKIGVFGENHVLGFIIGTIIGFFGDTPRKKPC